MKRTNDFWSCVRKKKIIKPDKTLQLAVSKVHLRWISPNSFIHLFACQIYFGFAHLFRSRFNSCFFSEIKIFPFFNLSYFILLLLIFILSVLYSVYTYALKRCRNGAVGDGVRWISLSKYAENFKFMSKNSFLWLLIIHDDTK